MHSLLLATLLVSAHAEPFRSCEHYLAGVGDSWAQYENRYLEIRRETKMIEAGTPANREVNDLLGRAFAEVLRGLDRYFSDVPGSDLREVHTTLERDFVHSEALPYLRKSMFPSIARMRALIDVINSARPFDPGEGYIYTRPEGGTLVVEGPFVDQFVRYWQGRDTDPFSIEDHVWVTLLGASKDKFKSAFAQYQSLASEREAIAREFETYCARMTRADPSVQKALAFLNTLMRPQAKSPFDRQLDEFDMTGISEARRLVDGSFFAMPLPVGFYGTRLNQRLRRTVQVMTLLLERDARAELRVIEKRAPELIRRETTRGRAVAKGRADQFAESDPVLVAIVEGFYTIAQTLNLLLVDEVPGGLDVGTLVRELTTPSPDAPSAVALMTLYLRMATLGPSTLTGSRFPRPLERDEHGHLTLSRALKGDLSARIEKNFVEARQQRGEGWRNHRKAIACPVARDLGIDAAARSFLRVFEALGN